MTEGWAVLAAGTFSLTPTTSSEPFSAVVTTVVTAVAAAIIHHPVLTLPQAVPVPAAAVVGVVVHLAEEAAAEVAVAVVADAEETNCA